MNSPYVKFYEKKENYLLYHIYEWLIEVVAECKVAQQETDLSVVDAREELLSKVLFLMNAPLTQLVLALKSPVQKLAYLLKQLEENKSQA